MICIIAFANYYIKINNIEIKFLQNPYTFVGNSILVIFWFLLDVLNASYSRYYLRHGIISWHIFYITFLFASVSPLISMSLIYHQCLFNTPNYIILFGELVVHVIITCLCALFMANTSIAYISPKQPLFIISTERLQQYLATFRLFWLM